MDCSFDPKNQAKGTFYLPNGVKARQPDPPASSLSQSAQKDEPNCNQHQENAMDCSFDPKNQAHRT